MSRGALPHLLVRLRAWAARHMLRSRLRQLELQEQQATAAAQALHDELAALRMERSTLKARLAYMEARPLRASTRARWSE